MAHNLILHYFLGILTGIFCAVAQAESLLLDTTFQQGYAVMSPQKDIYTNRVEMEAVHRLRSPDKTTSSTPDWRLVQWGSNQSLAGMPAQMVGGAARRWEIPVKYQGISTIYKALNLDINGELTLELNGQAEFDGHYLESLDEYWPHLLMAQNIQGKKLDSYQTIELSLDAKLLFDHKNQQAGYQTGIHAARFPLAIAVRNTLSGNIFWLSLVIYDDRYAESGFICQKCRMDNTGHEDCRIPEKLDEEGRWECPFDGNRWSSSAEKRGTRKMIFRIPTKAWTQDNIHNGKWAHYQINLIPYIKAGIQAARETRALKGFTTDLRFYELGFFSMGWEITGLNHAAITVKNLSLSGL